MNFSEQCFRIFEQATEAYHVTDNVDATVHNPYAVKSIEFYLYLKNWIDAVQWHLEDIIRNPEIDPVEALAIKRRIDKSNQDRTDLVELIDSFFLDKYKNVKVLPDATINTESPAWAIDRLSILTLKIYHMREEALPSIRLVVSRSWPSCWNRRRICRWLWINCYPISVTVRNT